MKVPTELISQWLDEGPAIDCAEYIAQRAAEWALEEAAGVCDELFADVPPYSAPDCVSAIRALKEQK